MQTKESCRHLVLENWMSMCELRLSVTLDPLLVLLPQNYEPVPLNSKISGSNNRDACALCNLPLSQLPYQCECGCLRGAQ